MNRLARTLAAYASAACLTLGLVLAGFGVLSPRVGDRDALAKAGVPTATLLVGMRSVSEQTPAGLQVATGRYYLVLPQSFAQRRLWVVTVEEDGSAVVRTSVVGFWWVLSTFLLSLAGTAWFWLRAPRSATQPSALRG